MRQTHFNRYQVINPGVEQQGLQYIGSLFSKEQQEVFYYLVLANTEQKSAQLFRQNEGDAVAKAIALPITHAYFLNKKLLIVTSDSLLKSVDVQNKTTIVSFQKQWTKNHANNWWKTIPLLLKTNPSSEQLVSILGIYAGSRYAHEKFWPSCPQNSFA